MKRFLFITLVAALFAVSADAQSNLKKVYDETIDPMVQIDKAVAQAKTQGKHVVCQLGGNWCRWCLMFADFMTKDAEISQFVDENFVYIHVNYNPRVRAEQAKAEQNAKLLKRLNNPGRFGYPVFIILDGNGKVLHIQDSSFLEQENSYNKEKVMRFFRNWTQKAVKG